MSDAGTAGGVEKRFYDDVYRAEHASAYGGDLEDAGWQDRVRALTAATRAWLESTGLAARPSAAILEIGCGLAYLRGIHPGWRGVEYSGSAVERVKARDGEATPIYEGDAQRLPFPDEAFDGVYSWAVLEHVPDPHLAFVEIDRVLRGGGVALLAPAWNCRPWTVEKLAERPYSSLGLRDRIRKWLIPFRERVVVRALLCVSGRLLDELRLLGGRPMRLRFKPLQPRWDLIETLGHVSDDDAVAIIDPHSAVCFFKSRGYEVLSHPTLLRRLTARSEDVVVRKKASR